MKKLFALLLVALLVTAGSYFFYLHQVEKRIEQVARQFSQVGGKLEYRDVLIALNGDIRIEDLFVRMPGRPLAFEIDRIALHTGGVMGVHSLARETRENRMPRELGLSVEGLTLSLSRLAGRGTQLFSADGCGEREGFSEADLREMGYTDLVTDLSLNYRLVGGATQVVFDLEAQMRRMVGLNLNLELALDSPSRNMGAVAMAMRSARLLYSTLEYRDLGWAERVSEFCTRVAGTDREAYRAARLEAWDQLWLELGFEPAPELTEEYRAFVQQPRRLRLTLDPRVDLGASDLATRPPRQLLPYVSLKAAANDRPLIPVELEPTGAPAQSEPGPAESSSDPQAAQTATEPEESGSRRRLDEPRERREVAVVELGEHLNRKVELEMQDDQTLRGRLVAVGERRLRLQRQLSGGYFVQPVKLKEIERAYLH